MKNFGLVSSLLGFALLLGFHGPDFICAACIPASGCEVALAYYIYNASTDSDLTSLATRFQAKEADILRYSGLNSSSTSSLSSGQVLYIPFSCQECNSGQLRHTFKYTVVPSDEGNTIASEKYQYLTTLKDMTIANGGGNLDFIYPNNILDIPVNCSCGDPEVSSQYGLFATYVAEDNDNAQSLATKFNISENLLQGYNKDLNLNLLQQFVDTLFVPAKDGNGLYPPFSKISGGKSKAVIVGASVGAACLLLAVAGTAFFYFCLHLPRKHKRVSNLENQQQGSRFVQATMGSSGAARPLSEESVYSTTTTSTLSSGLSNFSADRSVEYSYHELATATDNFSIGKKIGQGGYGSVFYGEIRGQKLAIKMMNMQATREFLAELKVLTRVHHTNLVRLIGYCTVESLFLVYEFVENGTLSQHLKASGKGDTFLTWPIRVQIALDAARGLEYIHEHTTPTYIHRDIKSSNILLDKDFRAKVADFGLTKLTESGNVSSTIPSRLVGTFGYMAPEYARFGDVSPKADVYSFGVVLFEIISGKEAIVHSMEGGSTTQSPKGGNSQGLVTLFEAVLNDVSGKENLRFLVDPGLHNDYPLESVWKMANLAKACTREEPQLRPNMRVAVVALMTLSSSTQEWETDHGMEGLMSGR